MNFGVEEAVLLVVAAFAVYFLYRKTFKNSGCNCGGGDKCISKQNKQGDEK